MRATVVMILTYLLYGCAANPDKIDPAPVAIDAYLRDSCSQLTYNKARDEDALASEEEEQRSVRRSDAWGIALIGLPVGRMAGGNREDQIAQLKGEIVAIDRVRTLCGCT